MTPARRVAIAGAGMAGTSLACALVERGYRGEIVLLDGRAAADEARTWCWWDVPGVAFREVASHRWPAWRVASDGVDVVRSSIEHPYLHLGGDRYFREVRTRLRDARVRYAYGDAVDAIDEAGPGVVVRRASGDAVEADVAIDARGARPAAGSLVQRFVGRRVRTRDPAFDPNVATLMDFAPAGRHLARFTYVLPFARDLALVEDTVITTHGADDPERSAAIDRYVAETLRTTVVDVGARERGAIPMAATAPPRPSRRLGHAGCAAGAGRASSGFAFVRTQRHVAALAEAILGGTRMPTVGTLRYRMLDRALLTLLRRRLVRAPDFFTAFFACGDPTVVARFLSDASSSFDDVRLLAALARDATARRRRPLGRASGDV